MKYEITYKLKNNSNHKEIVELTCEQPKINIDLYIKEMVNSNKDYISASVIEVTESIFVSYTKTEPQEHIHWDSVSMSVITALYNCKDQVRKLTSEKIIHVIGIPDMEFCIQVHEAIDLLQHGGYIKPNVSKPYNDTFSITTKGIELYITHTSPVKK